MGWKEAIFPYDWSQTNLQQVIMKGKFLIPSLREKSPIQAVLQRYCKGCISKWPLFPLQGSEGSLWCIFPLTPSNKNIHKNGVMKVTEDFRFFWRDLGIPVIIAPEIGIAFFKFGKTVTKLLGKFCPFIHSLSRICWNSCMFSAINISFCFWLLSKVSANPSASLVKNSTGKYWKRKWD